MGFEIKCPNEVRSDVIWVRPDRCNSNDIEFRKKTGTGLHCKCKKCGHDFLAFTNYKIHEDHREEDTLVL